VNGTVAPIRVTCACGSGKVGAPRSRPYAGEGAALHIKHCARDCPSCPKCRAGRHAPMARQRENRIARAVGGERNPGSGNRGGHDVRGAIVDIEETTQATIVAPLFKWWLGAVTQKKVAELLRRQHKPRMLWCNRDQDPRRGLVVMTGADAEVLVAMARGNQG
jgi:hypothetical protein